MGTLSGREIRNRLVKLALAEQDQRLVVSPLLEPEEQLRDDQASIDVRLGFEFALISPSTHAAVDEFPLGDTRPEPRDTRSEPPSLSSLYRRQYVSLGRSIVIHPHQLILGSTLEYLRLPNDLMAYVVGRSTWGRLGLIVATAIGIHPRFAGTLTLELRNLGETPITLYPGQVIAQLFFHTVDDADLAGPGIGQYSGAVDLIPRRLSSDATRAKINALKAMIKSNRP